MQIKTAEFVDGNIVITSISGSFFRDNKSIVVLVNGFKVSIVSKTADTILTSVPLGLDPGNYDVRLFDGVSSEYSNYLIVKIPIKVELLPPTPNPFVKETIEEKENKANQNNFIEYYSSSSESSQTSDISDSSISSNSISESSNTSNTSISSNSISSNSISSNSISSISSNSISSGSISSNSESSGSISSNSESSGSVSSGSISSESSISPAGAISFGIGAANTVTSVDTDISGNFYIGGYFISFDTNYLISGGSYPWYLSKNSNDGSLDTSWDAKFDVQVRDIEVNSGSSQIIVVGNFDNYFSSTLDTARGGIVRLSLTNGSLDTGFASVGFNGECLTVDTQSDGSVIVGGKFTTYNGVSASRFSALSSLNGTLLGNPSFNNDVNKVFVQNDDKILVAGNFTSLDSNPRNRLVRLNSNYTEDVTFDISSGFDNEIFDICEGPTLPEQSYYVCGFFTSWNGNSHNGIIRIVSDSGGFSVPAGWNSPLDSGSYVRTVKTQNDGKILIGGTLIVGGVTSYLLRLNSDGTLDNTFKSTSVNGTLNNDVWAIHTFVDSNEKIIIGGEFTLYDGNTVGRIAALTKDGNFIG
jgi:uncharacterized delta-60 repeat protein